MSTPVLVSAFYPLCDSERAERMLVRYSQMSTFFNIHLFVPPSFTSSIRLENTTLYHVAFEDLDTYKILQKTTSLPRIRSESKDTKNFMILMNAKSEFIQRVRDAGVEASHYIWIDAGISQIFKDPAASFRHLQERLVSYTFPKDHILIPGCWSAPQSNFDALLHKVCWRFCGGFFVVPAGCVDIFATAVFDGCREIQERSGLAIWEVNVWAWLEANTDWRPDWYASDHNDRIIQMPAEFYNATQQHQQEQTTISAYE